MGRKNKYETHVQPNLEKISEWFGDLDEAQICLKLGISRSAWETYKVKYSELREALIKGKQGLVNDLKASLKKKAKGFYYEETKTQIREENGKQIKVIEKYKKYAQPDTGAIHLLLKNLDNDWRNDDYATTKIKQEQLELNRQKVEADNW